MIDFEIQDQTRLYAIQKIGEKAGFKLSYDTELSQLHETIHLKMGNVPIEEALWAALKGSGLRFAISENRQLVLVPFEKPEETFFQETVTGRVSDAQTGQPIPGVNILIEGTTIGTSSDVDGFFELNVPDLEQTLIITYIGYDRKVVLLDGRNEVNLELISSIIAGDEIVVVGYGAIQKSDITGSIASVNLEDVKNFPVTGIQQAMQGQIAGVRVQQGSGTPGAAPIIRIRGTGSITAGNDPLYVIDGHVGATNLNNINMHDIESIEILKDASATAIYGSRGSNGVVLITTNSGISGSPRTEINAYFGVQELERKFDVLNAEQWVELFTEAQDRQYVDSGGSLDDPLDARPENMSYPAEFRNPSSFGKGTDWQDEIYQLAPIQNYSITTSGGSEDMRYFISGNYFNQEGIIKTSGYQRFNIRINADIDLTENLRFGIQAMPTYSITDHVNAEGHWGGNGVVLAALNQPPIFPTYEEDGSYGTLMRFGYGTPSIPSPLVSLNEIDDQRTNLDFLGVSYLEVNLFEGLAFRTSFSADMSRFQRNHYSTSQRERDGRPAPQPPEAIYENSSRINILSENIITYDTSFNNRHSINTVIGYTVQKNNFESGNVFATNFPNDLVRTINAGQVTSGDGRASEWALMSYLGRINYSFDNKYLATASIRRDGSSRFGAGNRWGYFPSGSLGWIISSEEFMQRISFVNNLKLRISHGFTGNESIPNYGSVGLLSGNNYAFGSGLGNLVNGIQPTSMSNRLLGWERTRETNVGIELGLFDDRVIFEVDHYYRNTNDLLLNVQVPTITGFSNTLQNIGEVKNVGWDFDLTTRNMLTNNFSWSTSLNLSTNKNEVLSLGPEGDPIFSGPSNYSITKIGHPIGSYYGFIFDGIYNTQEEIDSRPSLTSDRPGSIIIRDVNGDGEITQDDRTIIGDNNPDFIFGITNRISYRNFDFNLTVTGAYGYQVWMRDYTWLTFPTGIMNVSSELLERWRSPEDPGNGRIPRADGVTRGYQRQPSTNWIQDGTHARISNVYIGYSIPLDILGRLSLSSLRVYFQAQNLYTFTSFRGYNPDVSRTNNPLQPGMSEGGYPTSRSYTIGINLGF
ncbi:MAG: TonB-dependent receptor [Balneolaceae bacterium]|nr:TonB-dependent receptor [Balneolaceae bacterium]